ncbi:hypothetical protein GIB67_036101 [Kingdonia uniflora]|uniref:UMP kinase n=2 Tax=Magnoliopsida TaxID=3398 RepID=A0A7J7N8T0_9MAGN|nr:hypothetical protein GIB67_036101 [Kingdonia uniflora]
MAISVGFLSPVSLTKLSSSSPSLFSHKPHNHKSLSFNGRKKMVLNCSSSEMVSLPDPMGFRIWDMVDWLHVIHDGHERGVGIGVSTPRIPSDCWLFKHMFSLCSLHLMILISFISIQTSSHESQNVGMSLPRFQSTDFDNFGAMNITVNAQNLYDGPNVEPTEATSGGNTTGFQAPPSATSESFAPSGNSSTIRPHRISISIDNELITESARSWSLSLIGKLMGEPIGLKKWHVGFDSRTAKLVRAVVWDRLPGLPMELWAAKILWQITSALGRPARMDGTTARILRAWFARVCVEIGLDVPPPAEIEVSYLNLMVSQPNMSNRNPFGFTVGEAAMLEPSHKWRRVLLKVSGEALAGDQTQNIDPKITMSIAREVASVTRLGIEVAIVVGGGNIFRGSSWAGCSGLDRSSADHIGMLATVMNAIFLQATMESIGIPTRVQTAFRMSEVAEPYIRRRAIRHLEKGRVVIFAAGTGNPFFTTDTAAALRCAEKVLLKATNVDGVYDDNPRRNPNACLLDSVSYHDVISRDLSVMDMTAITLCQENDIPVVVFNLGKPGNISKAITGEAVGTLIGGKRERTEAKI